MALDTLGKAVEIVTKAVDEDNAENYEEALRLYEHGVDYFLHAMKYEVNGEKSKEAIRQKCVQYQERAEKLRQYVEGKNKKNPVASSGGGKERSKGGKHGKDESSGDEDEDAESKKLREQLNIKEGSPTNNDLEGLAHEIIDVWRQLGRRLLESDESLLVAIDRENPRYSEKAYQMLLKWKEAKGSNATFQVLHDALGHRFVNRRDLAEIFCKVKQD